MIFAFQAQIRKVFRGCLDASASWLTLFKTHLEPAFRGGRASLVAKLRFPLGLADNGHNPLDCKGQANSLSISAVGWACSADFRHLPGLSPKRLLKQVLKSPKWLNPHSSATLVILASRLRNKETAFSKRISILSAAMDMPKYW
jgi:hypothetical protein